MDDAPHKYAPCSRKAHYRRVRVRWSHRRRGWLCCASLLCQAILGQSACDEPGADEYVVTPCDGRIRQTVIRNCTKAPAELIRVPCEHGASDLQGRNTVLKDSSTLAFYNVLPGTELLIGLKARGGRK